MYPIGIALGGGGARGFAHLGILQALQEKGIKPDIIAGTSAGAIIGAFIASGKTPLETMSLLTQYSFTDLAALNFKSRGFLSLEKLKHTLKEAITYNLLEELPTPLIVAATNLQQGHITYFHQGSLVDIVQASASIPMLFTPVSINNELYVDGGLLDNVPVKPLIKKCERLIAVNISPLSPDESLKNIIDVAARTFQISVNANIPMVKKICDLYLEPDGIRDFPLLDTSYAEQLFNLGYTYCLKQEL